MSDSVNHACAGLLKTAFGLSQAMVTHTCNPSYSEGRDQKGHGSNPAQANSSQDPISKIPITKKGRLVEWLKVKALSSRSSTTQKRSLYFSTHFTISISI
jgi:hypothetical protein